LNTRSSLLIPLALAALVALPSACKGESAGGGSEGAIVAVDGSSTVYPITEAVAEAYRAKSPKTRVTIGVSGTGGGFKKFCAGELAIANASRPIKPSEIEACKAAGIDFVELPVAYDGMAVVVNPKATWVDQMTIDELKRLWSPEAQGKITRWSQIREGWPDEEIHLFGPGVDSGTYDYFTKAVVGTEHSSRGDYTSSEDDNVVVQGVSTDRLALGYFGFAYYEENKDKLKIVPIDDGDPSDGKGAIAPSRATVSDGTYQPLSRPIFIYVSMKAVTNSEVAGFIDYYVAETAKLSSQVGYIGLPADASALVSARWTARKTGSVFEGGGSTVGVTVQKLLAQEK
jgi:phosphate transport system substrate-binding protein